MVPVCMQDIQRVIPGSKPGVSLFTPGEHTRLGARASRPRRVYEGTMPSRPGEMRTLTGCRDFVYNRYG
jgi:hypothetical protein